MDPSGSRPQALFRGLDGSLRNIENRDLLVATGEQVVYKRRFPSADIDNRRRSFTRATFSQFQRDLKMGTIA